MFRISSPWRYTLAATMAAGLATHAAQAAPQQNTLDTINVLQLAPNQLSAKELGTLRGGFDVSPGISINFAFEQISYAGANAIQSIIVPVTTLTQAMPNIPVSVTSNGVTTVTPASVLNTAVTSTINNGQTVISSQLNNSGITNLVANQANNAFISQVTTMNIAISGMSQWLSQQQNNAALSNSMQYGHGSFH